MPEMVIGAAEMAPGIDLIFEGGIKDEITPQNLYLTEVRPMYILNYLPTGLIKHLGVHP